MTTALTKRDRLVNRASYAVEKAIRKGKLPPLPAQTCVDCGAQAECYDHRDYTCPLDVEPVCKACNNRRGPGWPYPEAGDGLTYKHEVEASGIRWSGLAGGDGFAPLEAKLAGGLTTQDIEAALVEQRMRDRTSRRLNAEYNCNRATSNAFSTGGQGGIRNVTGIARAEYFKRRDPWYA